MIGLFTMKLSFGGTLKTILVMLIISSTALCFTESMDSLTLEQRVFRLEKKVDSLQVAFAKNSIKKDEDNPFTSGKFVNWGRGITLEIHVNKSSGLEAGYTFVTKKHLRMGLLCGTEITRNDTTVPNAAFYGKTSLGTPVLLNFLSFTVYFKTLVYPAGGNFHANKPEHTRGGGAAGVDFEFWISSHLSVLAGAGQNFGTGAYQFIYNQLGLKYSFGESSKNINQAKVNADSR